MLKIKQLYNILESRIEFKDNQLFKITVLVEMSKGDIRAIYAFTKPKSGCLVLNPNQSLNFKLLEEIVEYGLVKIDKDYMDFDWVRLGEMVRKERNKFGMTLDEMAFWVKIPSTELSKIELGKKKLGYNKFNRIFYNLSIFNLDLNILSKKDREKYHLIVPSVIIKKDIFKNCLDELKVNDRISFPIDIGVIFKQYIPLYNKENGVLIITDSLDERKFFFKLDTNFDNYTNYGPIEGQNKKTWLLNIFKEMNLNECIIFNGWPYSTINNYICTFHQNQKEKFLKFRTIYDKIIVYRIN